MASARPREILSDALEPATPVDRATSPMQAAPFPHDGSSARRLAVNGTAQESDERSPLLARTPTPPFRETPPEDRRGLWPIRLSFFFATFLLFLSAASLVLVALSSVHPAITAVLPTHRGSTLLPAWLALVSTVTAVISLSYFAQPRWSPVRTASFFQALSIVCILIMIGFCAIDPDNRTRESVLSLSLLGLLLVTTIHAYVPPKVLPQIALQAYEQRRHHSWLHSAFSVVSVSLPLFILHIALFAAILLMTFDLALRTHDATLSPPGILVDVTPKAVASGRGLFDKGAVLGTTAFRVHLWCEGGSLPGDDPGLTVLLESDRGVPGTSHGRWALDALRNQTNVRVCRWDRPAYGFSDCAPSSELPYVAQALHDAMQSSGELSRLRATRGLVIVGNGYGGLLARVFSDRNPQLIHSILFADAETELLHYPGHPFTFERFFRTVVPDLSAPLGLRPLIALILYPSQRSREARKLSTAREGLSVTMPRARLQEHRSLSSANSVSARAIRASKRSGRPPARRAIVLSTAWRVRDPDDPWTESQAYLARTIVGEPALVRWSRVGPVKRPRSALERRVPLCESDDGRSACGEALVELLNT